MSIQNLIPVQNSFNKKKGSEYLDTQWKSFAIKLFTSFKIAISLDIRTKQRSVVEFQLSGERAANLCSLFYMLIESAVISRFDANSREENDNERFDKQCSDKPATNLNEEIKLIEES